jgi:hypothetical protein
MSAAERPVQATHKLSRLVAKDLVTSAVRARWLKRGGLGI